MSLRPRRRSVSVQKPEETKQKYLCYALFYDDKPDEPVLLGEGTTSASGPCGKTTMASFLISRDSDGITIRNTAGENLVQVKHSPTENGKVGWKLADVYYALNVVQLIASALYLLYVWLGPRVL